MIGRRGYRPDLSADVVAVNHVLNRLGGDLRQLDDVLADAMTEIGAPPCRVRLASVLTNGVIRQVTTMPPCERLADFEMFCRVCGHGVSCCAEHEQAVMNDAQVQCGNCAMRGPGALLFAFVPLGL